MSKGKKYCDEKIDCPILLDDVRLVSPYELFFSLLCVKGINFLRRYPSPGKYISFFSFLLKIFFFPFYASSKDINKKKYIPTKIFKFALLSFSSKKKLESHVKIR